jgi:hypothetical protein
MKKKLHKIKKGNNCRKHISMYRHKKHEKARKHDTSKKAFSKNMPLRKRHIKYLMGNSK